MKTPLFLLSITLPLVAAQADTPTQEANLGPYIIHRQGNHLALEKSQGGEIIQLLKPSKNWLQGGHVQLKHAENRASFQLQPRYKNHCTEQKLTGFEATPKHITVTGDLKGEHCELPFVLRFTLGASGHLQAQMTLEDNSAFVRWNIPHPPQENFYGGGIQASMLRLNGHRLPLITQEGGIGRGQPQITPWVNAFSKGSGGHSGSSYAPVPMVMSNHKRGIYSQSHSLGYMDLSHPGQLMIERYHSSDTLTFFSAPTPLEMVSEWSHFQGKPQQLPDWLHKGAQIGIQGGTPKVRRIWSQLQQEHTPIAAFWLQDWVGKRKTAIGSQLWWNWELDENQYPQWQALAKGLEQSGIALMGYINPFLVDAKAKGPHQRNLYQEAKAKGFLVTNKQGQPYPVKNTDFDAGLLDLTNPQAREWIQEVIQKQLIATGFKGWMADYGEALPLDATLHTGSAERVHNLYPVLWGKVNQAAIEASKRQDLSFFTRSGFTRSSAYAPYFWTGDQMVNWDEYDGFKSSIVALLSGGLSGFAVNHSDIGGYTSIFHEESGLGIKRDSELLKRWTEANAFTAIFRTHEGNQPEANIQFYSDAENLAFFARMAKIYALLFDYRKGLFQEAKTKGWPVVRPLWLHYPQDPQVVDLKSQWMLGSELLVAPVTAPGQRALKVYLPRGQWVHLWSQTTVDSQGEWVHTEAPLGQPAVFYPLGSTQGEKFYQGLKQKNLL